MRDIAQTAYHTKNRIFYTDPLPQGAMTSHINKKIWRGGATPSAAERCVALWKMDELVALID